MMDLDSVGAELPPCDPKEVDKAYGVPWRQMVPERKDGRDSGVSGGEDDLSILPGLSEI